MRFYAGLLGVLLVAAVCNANVVQRRNYRNTEEILVPVAIIQDGEEIKESVYLKDDPKEAEVKNLQPQVIAAVEDAAQKLESVEAAVQAQRRIDEAIVEEEINEAVKEEQVREIEQVLAEESKLSTTLAEAPQIVAVALNEESESIQEPDQTEKASDYKLEAITAQNLDQATAIVEENADASNADDGAQQPEGAVRQATQATPAQTTTQQNFVQQFIQSSPLGQFFNQITGQTTQSQVSNDDPAAAPALPGLFNPVAAVQNAAQSVVNSTTQAFQGLQQFASTLGNQFQNTLSGLGGQAQDQAANDGTTARPPGPIQQLVNTFIGTPQQAQPAPAQQGPLQGLLNIFQGNNRPQQAAAASTNPQSQPAKEPEPEQAPEAAAAAAETNDQANNEVRDSGEANDSFEELTQPEELIVVNDDADQTESQPEQEVANV